MTYHCKGVGTQSNPLDEIRGTYSEFTSSLSILPKIANVLRLPHAIHFKVSHAS